MFDIGASAGQHGSAKKQRIGGDVVLAKYRGWASFHQASQTLENPPWLLRAATLHAIPVWALPFSFINH